MIINIGCVRNTEKQYKEHLFLLPPHWTYTVDGSYTQYLKWNPGLTEFNGRSYYCQNQYFTFRLAHNKQH